MGRVFVVGSRGSALALSQTEAVVEELRRRAGAAVRVEIVRTTADQNRQTPLAQLPGIGFFVQELETALRSGRIDAAVHSMKDLPTENPLGLLIAAVPSREDPGDVLVARDGLTLRELPPGATVGTSSPRRTACLRAARPDLEVVPVRGNVDTRVRKVDRNELDAVCLAAAGLRRLGLAGRITDRLSMDLLLPAPGQGAVGVQVRGDDQRAIDLTGVVDDRPTRVAVGAERALLGRLQGGCRLPVGALAEITGDRLTLRGAVTAPDGSRRIEGRRTGSVGAAEDLGRDLADEFLARGAATLIPVGQAR